MRFECPKCKISIHAGKFCPYCGTELVRSNNQCSCGATFSNSNEKFCRECGKPREEKVPC